MVHADVADPRPKGSGVKSSHSHIIRRTCIRRVTIHNRRRRDFKHAVIKASKSNAYYTLRILQHAPLTFYSIIFITVILHTTHILYKGLPLTVSSVRTEKLPTKRNRRARKTN